MSYNIPQKIDLTPKRHHGYAVLLFIFGTLFPPLAVAARFGIGGDFWLNLLLTICGYIPGHGHNFYIQNIRNNKNHRRTPKWVQRYGLVDTSEIKRKERKSQWAHRYNDRLPESTLAGQAYEDGQNSGTDLSSDNASRSQRSEANREQLWRPEDESYYGQDSNTAESGTRWHYPANFEAASVDTAKKGRKKKEKKDRWARTEDAYEEAGKKKKRSKKSKSRDNASIASSRNSGAFPEDAEGGFYSNDEPTRGRLAPQKTGDDVFQHQF